MLVLSRKLSQQILIGTDIAITVVKIEGNHVRVGIEAPRGVSNLRNELVAPRKPNEASRTERPRLDTVSGPQAAVRF
jgi:carbon storage regulator